MSQLEITVGAARKFPLQSWLQGGVSPAKFAATDELSAYVLLGQDQARLLTLSVGWYLAPDPTTGAATQTGYDQGQVEPEITDIQSATLEPDGRYHLEVWNTPSGGRPYRIWEGTLWAKPSAGAASRAVAAYNQLADMTLHAPWIRDLQDATSDQEGFYSQRLRARQWLDDAILANYRGASAGNFEGASTMAFAFGGGVGYRRGLGPSPAMVAHLAADKLILRPAVIEACAYKAISYIGLAQVGLNAVQAAFGAYFRDLAERELCGITAEIDTNADGVGEIFVPLGSSNPLFT